jgi:hypothetical protein
MAYRKNMALGPDVAYGPNMAFGPDVAQRSRVGTERP